MAYRIVKTFAQVEYVIWMGIVSLISYVNFDNLLSSTLSGNLWSVSKGEDFIITNIKKNSTAV